IIDNTTGIALTLTPNNPMAWTGDFTFTGSNDLNLGAGAVTLSASRQLNVSARRLTVGGSIGPVANTLTKIGTGTLVHTGAATTSPIGVNAGTLGGGFTTSGLITLNGGTLE